ncbi:hypothetical protein SUGI_0511700 [Cryptomeria japonica]|nr:hypothetical protein SUGI_0511700 [Cryptomeria japonica]
MVKLIHRLVYGTSTIIHNTIMGPSMKGNNVTDNQSLVLHEPTPALGENIALVVVLVGVMEPPWCPQRSRAVPFHLNARPLGSTFPRPQSTPHAPHR